MKSYNELFGGPFVRELDDYSNIPPFWQQITQPVVPIIQEKSPQSQNKTSPVESASESAEETEQQEVDNSENSEFPEVQNDNVTESSLNQNTDNSLRQSEDIIVQEATHNNETGVAIYENVEEFEVKKGLFGRLIAKKKKVSK